jgi:hypothetical protein
MLFLHWPANKKKSLIKNSDNEFVLFHLELIVPSNNHALYNIYLPLQWQQKMNVELLLFELFDDL